MEKKPASSLNQMTCRTFREVVASIINKNKTKKKTKTNTHTHKNPTPNTDQESETEPILTAELLSRLHDCASSLRWLCNQKMLLRTSYFVHVGRIEPLIFFS